MAYYYQNQITAAPAAQQLIPMQIDQAQQMQFAQLNYQYTQPPNINNTFTQFPVQDMPQLQNTTPHETHFIYQQQHAPLVSQDSEWKTVVNKKRGRQDNTHKQTEQSSAVYLPETTDSVRNNQLITDM